MPPVIGGSGVAGKNRGEGGKQRRAVGSDRAPSCTGTALLTDGAPGREGRSPRDAEPMLYGRGVK